MNASYLRTGVSCRRCVVSIAFATFTAAVSGVHPAGAEELNVAVGDSSASVTEPLVVTAGRHPQQRQTLGSAVSIITREEIEAKKELSVLELLRGEPGVTVFQHGGPGRTSGVLIRGGESDQTLILIDGIRANDNTSGQYDISALMTDNIERIEIVRGSQSVVHGSEAMGGVINIITRRGGAQPEAVFSARGGSFGTHEYQASASGSYGLVDNATALSYLRTDGISSADRSLGNREKDSYENFTFSTRTGLRIGEDGRADLTLRYSHAEAELDGASLEGVPVDALDFVQKRDQLQASITISKPVTDWFTPKVELGFVDDDIKGTDPFVDFNNYTIDNQLLSARAEGGFQALENNVLTLGYQYEHREGKNKGLFEATEDIHSLYIEDNHAFFDALYVTLGTRYDRYTSFGDEFTYRATLAYLLNDIGGRVHSSYGTGFKAPSFNELFFPNFGNEDLEEETSWSVDLGYEQTLLEGRLLFDITFFYSSYDDLIAFDTTVLKPINIDEAWAQGIETSFDYTINDMFETVLHYTYMESENETTGRILPRRPRHQGTVDLYITPTDKLQGVLTLLVVNSRRDSNGQRMDNYERVDAAVSYQLHPRIKPFVRIENLFDQDYEELPGFGTPGFSIYGGIEARI